MPIEVESASQVEEFVRVLRKRTWWILVPLALFASLGTTYGVLVPKKYVSRTRVMVRQVFGHDGKPMRGQASGKVAAHLIRARPRVQAAIEDLKWEWLFLTRMEQEDLKDQVLDDLTVTTPGMGFSVVDQIVEISYANTDRQKAFEFVKLISERWQDGVLDSYRTARQEKFRKLQERREQTNKEAEAIGLEVAELMKRHGIPPWSGIPGVEPRLAPEFEALIGYREREEALVLQIADALRALAQKQDTYDREEDEIPETVAIEGTSHDEAILEIEKQITDLKTQIATGGYKPAHSRWNQVQAELKGLEEQKKTLEASRTAASETQRLVENAFKLQLRLDLERDALELESMEDQLKSLGTLIANTEAETEELQDVYQELTSMYLKRNRLDEELVEMNNQVRAEQAEIDELMSAAGVPFEVLEKPGLPTRPTEPDPLLIILFSVVAGLALGLALAVAREYGRNCFRNVNDITRVMIVPVLGTVNAIVTASQRRRSLAARAVIGGATLVVVLTLGYITWAWSGHQEMLSDGMRDNIERFRRAFE